MRTRKFRLKGRPGDSGPKPVREWVGGTIRAPFFLHDRDEPYRPLVALWLEMPDGFVVSQDVLDDEDREDGIAGALREAMASPMVGTPRRPDAIRVDDEATATAVRAEVGPDIPVEIAPTPELHDVFQALFQAVAESPTDVEPSYLEQGRLSPAAVAALFEAGRALFAHAPWTTTGDAPLLWMDIPSLGVEDAIVAVIGQTSDFRGLLIFASVDDLDAYFDAAEEEAYKTGNLGAGLLSLTFEPAAELPPSMRREAMEHGWPVHAPDAYPVVQKREADGVPNPLTAGDLRIATACAEALAALLDKHATLPDAAKIDHLAETYFNEHGREVRLSFLDQDVDDDDPFDFGTEEIDAYEPFPELGPFQPRAGRNEPCPCGSGRKYKKCHLPIEESRHDEGRRATSAHAMDAQLVPELAEYAQRKFGKAWRTFHRDLSATCDARLLVLPLAVFTYENGGATLVDAYLNEHGRHATPEERRWLKAQQAAWLSVWEVEAVEPGRTLSLHDLLSGERRTVLERKGSEVLTVRDAVLARVVDHDGLSLVAGFHPSMLAPYGAAEVVERARLALDLDGAVPVDRLRAAAAGEALLEYWEEAANEEKLRRSLPPRLVNTDDDPLLFTVDRFEVAAGAARRVGQSILDIEGMIEDEDEDGPMYVLLRPKDRSETESTVLASIRWDAEGLRVETNSVARADYALHHIMDACGESIRHLGREHTEPPRPETASRAPLPEPSPPSPETKRLLAESKARHYAEWPDIPLPALDDRTPRECARTPDGRREVDLLLRHMENMEHRAPGEPFDFSTLREDLGIPSP